jgi:hypothetical protein
MKLPNPSNIDQWLFHYFEGDLSANEETILENFMLENPQFDDQFEAWGASRISKVEFEFVNRHNLLKPLVSPILLKRIAVLTAIGVNGILASFLLFTDTNKTDAWKASGNVFSTFGQISSDFSETGQSDLIRASLSLPKHKLASNASVVPSKKNNEVYDFLISVEAILDEHLSVVHTEITHEPEYLSLESSAAEQLVDQFLLIDDERIEFHDAFASKEITKQVSETLDDFSNEVIVNESAPFGVIQEVSSVPPSKSGNSKSKNDSESREQRTFIRHNRFNSGGELSLTNNRDIDYLVPGANRNHINFGHVSSDFASSFYTNTYMQWPNQSSALMSNQIGLDIYLPEVKSGVGIQMAFDRFANGAINNYELALTYSPKFFLDRKRNVILEPAARVTLGGTGVDRNLLTPGTLIEFDRSNSFIYTDFQHEAQVNRSVGHDLGLGFLLNTKWGFAGANADNLLGTRNQALHFGSDMFANRTPIFFNAVLGTEYESRNKKMRISGQIVYQNFGELNKLWFGSRVKYNSISLGASVSSAGEPMLSLGWISRQISILYSTDYALSQMSGNKHLSHQLTMRVTLKESRLRKLMLN